MAYKRQSAQPVIEGGTGAVTLTDHGVLVGSGTSAVDALTAGSNGQALIGSTGVDPVFATLGSTVGTIEYTTGAGSLALDVNAGLRITTGFATWGGAGAYFDDTTLGDFTLLRPGTGYINSKPISWLGAQTVTGLTAGNTYWIYIDNTGTLQKTATFTTALFTDNIVLFECLRDSTPITNNQITVKENHTFGFQQLISVYLHETIGCIIENNANGANITLNGTQGIQINGDDELTDHGLYTDIPDSGGVAETWHKFYTTAGGKWATQNVTNTFTGYWNSAGTPTALTAGKFAIYTLYVSKDNLNSSTPTYFAVLDTAQYNTLVAANTAISNGTIAKATNELASLEVAQLGYIVYRESTASIVQVTISKATLKQTLSTGGTNTAALVNTVVTSFNNVLSSADTNVQAALDTLDDFGSGTGNQTVNLYNGAGVKIVALGSINTTSSTAINCGTGGFTLTSASGNIISSTGLGVITLLNDLDVTEGGTGVSTLTSHGILMGNGAGDIQATAEPSNGQLLIGSTGNFPVLASLTAGAGISITPGAGTISIASTSTGLVWSAVTVDAAFTVNTGTFANKAGLLTMTLPATAALGDVIEIANMNTAVGWRIAQNANQYIRLGSSLTTTGVGGYLEATQLGDSVKLVCNVAGASTGYIVTSSMGNITIV